MQGVPFIGLGIAIVATALAVLAWEIRRRNLASWLPGYFVDTSRRRTPRPDEEIHVLLCLADHFEPKGGNAAPEQAWQRVRRWVSDYPRALGEFRDSDGRPPRHTFFYPAEEYEPEYLDALTELVAGGFGEIEVHLHHDQDTAEGVRRKLLTFQKHLAERHGLLSRDRSTKAIRYGFIHGNWALDNSGPHGRDCGVANELSVLRETGCYADFTLPSAPEPAQTRTINRIYYAVGQPGRSKAHDTGWEAGSGSVPPDALMLIQGPLMLDWRKRKWGVFPRIENGCIQKSQPATLERLRLWLNARVQVAGRPDWFFVKLHTHGADEANHDVLLGEPMRRFHGDLQRWAAASPRRHYHYVTARELYNLARAAEAGWQGSVAEARDHELLCRHEPAQPVQARAGGSPTEASDWHEVCTE